MVLSAEQDDRTAPDLIAAGIVVSLGTTPLSLLHFYFSV